MGNGNVSLRRGGEDEAVAGGWSNGRAGRFAESDGSAGGSQSRPRVTSRLKSRGSNDTENIAAGIERWAKRGTHAMNLPSNLNARFFCFTRIATVLESFGRNCEESR